MANDKQKQFRFEVKQYMSEHRELSDAQVVKHFVKQGKCRSSIYTIIKNFKQRLNINRKEGLGRKPIKTDGKTDSF